VNRLLGILINICRIAVAVTLILSGYVKAIDPMGTHYKIQDYLGALSLGGMLPDWSTITASVLLSALEFSLGIFLLFAIHRRLVSKLVLALMALMTIVSAWLWMANPISDCGCFGDALHLTNGQTFAKNIALLAASAIVCRWPLRMVRFISRTNQWIVINYTLVFIILTSAYCLYYLPLFDFRPYHVGANLRAGMEVPDSAEQPQFETTFILEKDGEQREFTLADYPDSTWTFVDSKTKMVSEGYVPPIHDFSITRIDDGEDITDAVVDDPGYTFLLIAPRLETADDGNFGKIDQLYEYCSDHGYAFYCLTASGEREIERWRELTGAEYPFCATDGTTLKTIIRSNPGLLLLHQGNVMGKWSHRRLPEVTPEESSQPIEHLPAFAMPTDKASGKVLRAMGWFVLPLLALTLADRLWAWTRWVRRKEKKENNSSNNNPTSKQQQ